MKFILALSSVWFFLTPSKANNGGCLHDNNNFRCVQILGNYDGDTITVNIPGVHPLLGEKVSVRVEGIDTPEIKTTDACEKSAGRAAQRLVSNLLKNAKRIDLEKVQRDKYFRILATVSIDGKSLKDTLIKNKLAYEYHGGTKMKVNWCQVNGRLPASLNR
jgi:endonuclease YncB( thermonuclease family)